MPSKRPDHFAHMRAEPATAAEPPEGAPIVSPALIDWLEKVFPVASVSPPGTVDGAVYALSTLAIGQGEQGVIAHLRTLVRSA